MVPIWDFPIYSGKPLEDLCMAHRPLVLRWRRGVSFTLMVFWMSLIFAVAPPAHGDEAKGPGRWVRKAKMLLARTEISVAELNGRIYVVGGYVEGSVTSFLNQEYNPATNTWKNRRRLPLGLNHVGLAAHQGKLYAFGGFIRQNRDPVSNAFVYDPQTDRWKEIASMPSKRGAVAVVSLGDKLHLIGGAHGVQRGERRSVNEHFVYDIKTNSYANRAPLPVRRDHMGLVAVSGKIHAIGGRLESFNNNSPLHHAYDPDTEKWVELAKLPTPRSGFAAALLDGLIIVIGGEGRQGVFNENEAYDPGTNRWIRLAPMPSPRHGTGAAVIGSMMYIPGGGPVKGGSRRSDIFEVFSLK